MLSGQTKSLLVAAFSAIILIFSQKAFSQEHGSKIENVSKNAEGQEKKGFDAKEVIFGHVLDAHEFHFLSYKGSNGEEHEVAIPLPVILYSPQKGFSCFMYSAFHHG